MIKRRTGGIVNELHTFTIVYVGSGVIFRLALSRYRTQFPVTTWVLRNFELIMAVVSIIAYGWLCGALTFKRKPKETSLRNYKNQVDRELLNAKKEKEDE